MHPPPNIHASTQRSTAAIKGVLELRQAIGRVGDDLGLTSEEVTLLMAIKLGDVEKRPMDISTLAAVTAMTFPTTHRLLKQLRERGLIEARQEGRRLVHHCSGDFLERPQAARTFAAIEGILQNIATRLSKLDK